MSQPEPLDALDASLGDDAPVVTDPRRRTLIMAGMCTALVAVVASVSGLNVAQQDLALDLGASQGQLLWMINGYTLALAALLMPVGAIGDRWGRKPVLVVGLVLFALANVVAALASTPEVLIGARVAAGVGAAMIMPVTLSVITSSFPAEARGRAVGIWAGFAGAGGILGLLSSAFLIDYFSWPWLFAGPVVLALVAAALAIAAVPNSREHAEGRFDTLGSLLSVVAVGGLVLGVHEGPEQGWTDPVTIASLVAGGAALVGFIAWERRQRFPLLDPRVFADRALASGSVVLVVLFTVLFGIFLVLILFMQTVLGYSALRAAAGLLPIALVSMVLSPLAPGIAKRVGLKATLVVGLGLVGVGLATMAVLVDDPSYWTLLPGLVIMSVGMGLTMSPSTTAITESLPEAKQGVASALNDTTREIGGALGVALLGSILNAGYRANVDGFATGLEPAAADRVREGIGGAAEVAATMGAEGLAVMGAAQRALIDGWILAMWVGVSLVAVATAFVALRAPRTTVAGVHAATAPAQPGPGETSLALAPKLQSAALGSNVVVGGEEPGSTTFTSES